MLNSFQFFFLIMIFSESLLGILGNGFIGLINCIHWVKSSKISLSDFIIMNLSFSRIFLQSVIIFDGITLVFFPSFFVTEVSIQFRAIGWTISNCLNVWLFTCLGVFYCLKIAIFYHPAFLWLKWRISKVVAWMLLGSLLFCFFSTVSLIGKFHMYSALLNMKLIANNTEIVKIKEREFYVTHVLGTLWTLIPFPICLVSYLLLILSLRRHTRIMKQHVTVPRDPRTKAHVKATKVMLSFVFLFVIYCALVCFGASAVFLTDTTFVIMMVELALALYPSIHSFILILKNKNLKQAFLKLLWLEKNFMKGWVRGPLPPRVRGRLVPVLKS